MDNTAIITILTIVGSMLGSVIGVWALTRKNASDVAKEQAFSVIKTQNADTQERADLIAMLKESGKQSVTWLETLRITEHQRQLDYASNKNLIEGGTLETINSRKEIVKGVDGLSAKADEHHTGTTNILNEVQKEIAEIRRSVDVIPGKHAEILKRLDTVLGAVEMLRPKRVTSELSAVTSTNGTLTEVPTPSSS